MKLYECPRNTWVKTEDGFTFFFCYVDGMFSLCRDEEDNVFHPSASTEVELTTQPSKGKTMTFYQLQRKNGSTIKALFSSYEAARREARKRIRKAVAQGKAVRQGMWDNISRNPTCLSVYGYRIKKKTLATAF